MTYELPCHNCGTCHAEREPCFRPTINDTTLKFLGMTVDQILKLRDFWLEFHTELPKDESLS